MPIELLDEGGQLFNASTDLLSDGVIGADSVAVLFARAVLDELGATIGQGSPAAGGGRGFLGGLGLRGLAEAGQDGGIDGIGIGEHLQALRKVPNTARLDDRDGDSGVVQSIGQGALVTSRGFKNDMRLVVLREKFDQGVKPFVRVGQHAKRLL